MYSLTELSSDKLLMGDFLHSNIGYLIASNALTPFIEAYIDSDFIGRLIFIFLFLLSLISWAILIYKWWIIHQVKTKSLQFKSAFQEQKNRPLYISFISNSSQEIPNGFYIIYSILQTKAYECIEINKNNIEKIEERHLHILTSEDFSILETQATTIIVMITKYLEKHLYLLSTIVTLAPFLGLLGTVYGILVTFSGLAPGSGAGSTQQILGGLSLALTTTIIGLLNAIPALIGYNSLKTYIIDFNHEMNRFATDILFAFDAHHRWRDPIISKRTDEKQATDTMLG